MSLLPQSLGSPKSVILQPLDQSQAPGTRPDYPFITNISSEPRPDGNEAVYVQTFLIDAVTSNKKGWKVSYDNPADFDRRVQESLNHPLVLFPTADKRGTLVYDHPVAPITSMEAAADPVRANIEFQKRYTIGHARFFKKIKDGVWAATYEITNNKAKRFFLNAKNKGLKLFTSPYIVRPTDEANRNNIKEWALIHNAIVSQPAFGDKAAIRNICTSSIGNPFACASLFASVSDIDDLEFDVEEALELVTSQVATNSLSQDMTNESASQTVLVENPVNTIPPQQQAEPVIERQGMQSPKVIHEERPQPQQQQEQQQQQQDQTPKSEIELLKEQINNLTRANQSLEEKYAFDTRKAEIKSIFAPVKEILFVDKNGEIDEKAFESEIVKLTKQPYSLEHIQELARARFINSQLESGRLQPTPQNPTGKKSERASLTSHSDEAPNYAKLATNNNDDCGCPNTIGASIFKRSLINGGFL